MTQIDYNLTKIDYDTDQLQLIEIDYDPDRKQLTIQVSFC